MPNRSLVSLLLVLVWPHAGLAAAPLTESDVIRLAKTRAPEVALVRAQEDYAAQHEDNAAPLNNPSVTWQQQALPGEREDSLVLSLPLPFSSRGAQRALAATGSAWMRVEAADVRRGTILEALLLYYQVIFAEKRLKEAQGAVTNLEEASRVLARRADAGVASLYETTRLTLATELARSRVTEAQGVVTSLRAALAPRLGMSHQGLTVDETVPLRDLPPRSQLLAYATGTSPAMQNASSATQHAKQAEKESRFSWLPSMTVSGGVRRFAAEEARYGYIVGLSLALPVFNQGQALRDETRATAKIAEARVRVLSSRIETEVEGLLAQHEAARTDLENFDKKTTEPIRQLLIAAQSGYREGERSIIELLDAQHLQTEVNERRLTLLSSVKTAEARLLSLAGEFE